jgi:hypothetical protein
MADAPANPTLPVLSFFEPARNIAMLTATGVTVHCGPEIENRKGMTPAAVAAKEAEWLKAVADAGAKCVLKNPTGPLPAHCVGVILNDDEPNAKNVPPATVKAESDALRAAYPGVTVFLSLAGDKILSANLRRPAELANLQGYLACADVVTANFYSKNRNATRYPTTHTGDIVKTIKAVDPRVKVVPWVEINDQRLPVPTSQTVPGVTDVNREPTPDEIKSTVDNAIAMGADGIGWFATCDSGKYGWGTVGDSYWPLVNRKGESIQPQLDMVASISRALTGAAPGPLPDPPPADDRDAAIARLSRELADAERRAATAEQGRADALAQVASLRTQLDAVLADVRAITEAHGRLVVAATRPAGAGN